MIPATNSLTSQYFSPRPKRFIELLGKGASLDEFQRNITPDQIQHERFNGCTLLLLACLHDKKELVEWLLDQKADIEASNHHWLFADLKQEVTPLQLAAFLGHSDLLQSLLKRGANRENCCDTNETALDLATRMGRTQCVRILLDAGDDMEKKVAWSGATQLYTSIFYEQFDTMEYLLERGAKTETKTNTGTNVLGLVLMRRYDKYNTVSLLLNHGASMEEARIENQPALSWLIDNNDSGISMRTLRFIGNNLIEELSKWSKKIDHANEQPTILQQFHVEDPIPLLRLLGNYSAFMNCLNSSSKAPSSSTSSDEISKLSNKYAEESILFILKILFSDCFVKRLNYLLGEWDIFLDVAHPKPSVLSRRHSTIREFNTAMKSFETIYSIVLSNQFLSAYKEKISKILLKGKQLEDRARARLLLLEQKDPKKLEEKFNGEDALTLLGEFQVGVGSTGQFNAMESYPNLVGCEAQDLNSVGIQSGKDLRSLGINLSLKRLCNSFKEEIDSAEKQLLWKQLAETAQTMAGFLKEFSPDRLKKENLSELGDSLIRETTTPPSKKEETDRLKTIIDLHKQYSLGLIRLYVSQGISELRDFLAKNGAESVADLRSKPSIIELYSLVESSGKKQKIN